MTSETNGKQYVIGLFKEEDQAVSAIQALMESNWEIDDVYTPVPSKKIREALYLKPSKVGYFTLCGGILGFILGWILTVFSVSQWTLIVSGKPVISLVPFFIVSFELTIVCSVIGNVLGFLLLTDLPRSKLPRHYFTECSGGFFGIVAACNAGDYKQLSSLFDQHGGEIRLF
ncbi:MAG: DUF3341 domain-containing protein [Desulfobacteraceae bacterium]|nr:DUF3341 domain-containing protein [Desulfobacteraceae bacterium]MBU4001837.1 DUF3341 domain-containing protein [Pseudomonadota bacterium]MBU4053716.1 DUF3341 domain-containing protein [Pseudomonadota bacterium]